MMVIIFRILAILLGTLGLYIATMNWRIFAHNLRQGKYVSHVPLVGGVLLYAAMRISCYEPLDNWSGIAFIIDFGSIPLFAITFIYLLYNGLRKMYRELAAWLHSFFE